MRGTAKGNLLATLNIANEREERLYDLWKFKYKPVKLDLLYYGGKKYAIVDINDYGRVIIRGSLTYLQGFMDGYLYIH